MITAQSGLNPGDRKTIGAKNIPDAPHACDIHKIARQCGIRILNGAQQYHKKRRAGVCYCPATLRRIGRSHGSVHLAWVLRLVRETDDNSTELFADTISAISSLLIHHPQLLDLGAGLFDAFDRISLADLRQQAQKLACGCPSGHVLRVLLALAIRDAVAASTRQTVK